METHTQIIEMYGVPACGKSSIAEYIVRNKMLYNVGTKTDMYRDFGNGSICNKLKSISLYSFINGVRLIHFFPKEEKRKILSTRQFLKTAWCRNFQRLYGMYDNIISDHGIIQEIVTWERGTDYSKNNTFISIVNKYLNKEKDIVFVYCNIDLKTAITRIRKRGRLQGRLDSIQNCNDEVLYNEFRQERERFEGLSSILKAKGFKVITINTNGSIEDNVYELINCINSI